MLPRTDYHPRLWEVTESWLHCGRRGGRSIEIHPVRGQAENRATVFPEDLKVGSINALKILFADVSEGLHGLSKARCIGIADKIRTVFEYVFEKLKAEVDDRRAFVEKVRKLA